jgi:hypothetical protein
VCRKLHYKAINASLSATAFAVQKSTLIKCTDQNHNFQYKLKEKLLNEKISESYLRSLKVENVFTEKYIMLHFCALFCVIL